MIEKGEPFKLFNLTFTNKDLAALVNQKIEELPTLPYDYLLHKHMLRDRTDILEARKISKLRHSSKTFDDKL